MSLTSSPLLVSGVYLVDPFILALTVTLPSSMLLLSHVSHIKIWTHFPAWKPSIVPSARRSWPLGPLSTSPVFPLLNLMLLLYWCFCVFLHDRAVHKSGPLLTQRPAPPPWQFCPFPLWWQLLFTTAYPSMQLGILSLCWAQLNSSPHFLQFRSTKFLWWLLAKC